MEIENEILTKDMDAPKIYRWDNESLKVIDNNPSYDVLEDVWVGIKDNIPKVYDIFLEHHIYQKYIQF